MAKENISSAGLSVTLVRSVIGRIESHKATVRGLGLRRMNHTVIVQDTPAIRGMINTVGYLLKVSSSVTTPKVEVRSKLTSQAQKLSALPKKYLTKTGDDNLTVVEGIGPKISELLIVAGINTFAQLATTSVAKIAEILTAAGSRYALANPGTWPEQASLLAAGKVEEFEKLTEELDGGVRK